MFVRFVTLAVVLCVVAGSTTAQEKKGAPPDMQKMMEMMSKHATPGEAHKVFDYYVGNWTYTGKLWMDPSAPAMDMAGKSEGKTVLGGRFYTEHAVSSDPAMPFEGMACWGYDNHTKKYFFAWIDSMTTSLTTGEGTYDAAKKTMTWTSEGYDPMKGKNIKMKEISVVGSDGNITKTFYSLEGGKEIKSMELRLKRAK
jgi:hypothetical protein